MVSYMAPCMVPYMAPYMTPHGIQVGRGGVGGGVSKSMGRLRGGAPHEYAGGGCLGRGGRQPSPPRKILPSLLSIHISKYPYAHININSYQSSQKSITLKSMICWSKNTQLHFLEFSGHQIGTILKSFALTFQSASI